MATKTRNHGDLAEGIERLVREYISIIRIAGEEALEERAVATSGGAKRLRAQDSGSRHGRRAARRTDWWR